MVAIVDSYRVTNMIEGDGKELDGGWRREVKEYSSSHLFIWVEKVLGPL